MRHKRRTFLTLPIMATRSLQERLERTRELIGTGITRPPRCKENHVDTRRGKRACACRFAKLALRTVAQHSIPQPLRCSEGDPPGAAFTFTIAYDHTYQGVVVSPPLLEYAFKIQPGLDGPHTQTRVETRR